MGPLSRLIKKIFGKKEEPKKKQLSVHQTKQVADAVKKADAGEFASPAKVAEIKEKWSEPALKEKVDIEYEKASAPVAKATPAQHDPSKGVKAKTTPAYHDPNKGVKAKATPAYHRDDDEDDSFVRNSFYSASAYSSDSYSSISDSSSSCSSDSYSSSSDSSSSSSCDSSSW